MAVLRLRGMSTASIGGLLRRPTFSFEYFPPADVAGAYSLLSSVHHLADLRPDWVSITYGASGSTRQRTFDAVQAIYEFARGVEVMGHLTVASQTLEETRSALATYRDLGVKNILALRGDMPEGPLEPFRRTGDGLVNATQLVKLIKQEGDFGVGVAAFPDGHPGSRDLDLDARILLEKEEAGAEFAITQLFFRAESYFGLVERYRALGGTMPIVAGIMPVTRVNQIERFESLAGVDMPDALARALREASRDLKKFREVGLEWMTGLCGELLAGGAPGLQFFTLNRSTATREILARLRDADRRPA